MIQYRSLHKFIFSACILLGACESSSTVIPTGEINSISFLNGSTQTYTIEINNESVGTNDISITTGIQRTIDEQSYSFIIEYNETIILNDISNEQATYFKEYSGGHTYFGWNSGPSAYKFIPFPIKYGETLYGPFGLINSEPLLVTIVDIHSSYINSNNHTFSNVFEAQNEDGTIKVFLNETYFIIQKEDYRYGTTIQSLVISE